MGPEAIRWREMRNMISDRIDEFGWTAIGVFPTVSAPNGFPFTYTIGLTARKLPELVLFGMSNRQAHAIIASAIANLDLSKVEEYVSYDEVGNLPVQFRNLPQSVVEEYLCQATSYYGDRKLVRARQLVWPDTRGRFPWHIDCEPKYAQCQSEAVNWRTH